MHILVIGDIILDKYIQGDTSRISPEAPVPIVKIQKEWSTLGGAANVAHNLSTLDEKVALIGAIGSDDNGSVVTKLLADKKIENKCIVTQIFQTTAKTRVVSRNQQMLRVDREDDFVHDENTRSSLANSINQMDTGLAIISDYAKGFCSPTILADIFKSLHAKNVKILVDPKGQDWSKYNGAFLIKPNLTELEEICNTKISDDDASVAKYGKEVHSRYQIENLLVTRGKKGMTLITATEVLHFPTRSVEVYDVSGAGDTAMAVIGYELHQGNTLNQAIIKANLASSYVVTKAATYAINKEEYDKLSSVL
jgi:rfaE bifunctional protein kinase chain/domain